MRVPQKLTFLGFLYEMVWRTPGGAPKITLVKLQTSLNVRARDVYGLFSNGSGTMIYMLPLKTLDYTERTGKNGEQRLSKIWNGYEADLNLIFTIPNTATTLKRVGILEKIEYTSDKLERTGDRKGDFSLYTHRYKTPLHLYADRELNPRAFCAKLNSKRIVTSRGLVG